MQTRPMRSGIAATALSLLLAVSASAYELRLEATSPTTVSLGELVSFDVFLDTQGESEIMIIGAGLAYDPNAFWYHPDLSDANDYALYTPGSGKGDPPIWLDPAPNADCCDPPAIWTGSGPRQVLIFFSSSGLIQEISTTATATSEYLATLTFAATEPGEHLFDLSLDLNGHAFTVGSGGIYEEISSEVSVVGDTLVTVIPEPGTAVLIGAGLFALARSRPRRRSEP